MWVILKINVFLSLLLPCVLSSPNITEPSTNQGPKFNIALNISIPLCFVLIILGLLIYLHCFAKRNVDYSHRRREVHESVGSQPQNQQQRLLVPSVKDAVDRN